MRRTGPPRVQALFLCLTLMLGGFGLPLLDAAWFHSAPARHLVQSDSELQGQRANGTAHALGCALLTSAASVRGLPALGVSPLHDVPRPAGPALIRDCAPVPAPVTLQSLPRAPPSA